MSSPQRKPSAIVELEGDRALALLHVPRAVQPAMAALWAIDAALESVVARTSDPMLARIKLAWWRDQLEELERGPAPPEPRLQAVAGHLHALGIRARELALLTIGWEALLDNPIDWRLVKERGAHLFRMSADLLGAADQRVHDAGAFQALMSAARMGVCPDSAGPKDFVRSLRGHRFARRVRPLTALAALAARDLRKGEPYEPQGTASRGLAVIAHRWFGRVA